MRDTSLDEFLGTSDDGQSELTSEEEREESKDSEGTSDRDGGSSNGGKPEETADPAAVTYAWTPEGATCTACGTTVERRWRADGRLVCADCKEW
jgi:hypothetical protein